MKPRIVFIRESSALQRKELVVQTFEDTDKESQEEWDVVKAAVRKALRKFLARETDAIRRFCRWWWRFEAMAKKSSKADIAVFTILAIIGAYGFQRYFFSSDRAAAKIPGGPTITIVRTPFPNSSFAEYTRELKVAGHGVHLRIPMLSDTGGLVRTNLYQLSDGRFLVQDGLQSYLIDLKNPNAETVKGADGGKLNFRNERYNTSEAIPPSGGTFLGAFDETNHENFRFIPPGERPEMVAGFGMGFENEFRAGYLRAIREAGGSQAYPAFARR